MKEELLIVIFLLLGPILDVLAFYNIPVSIVFRGIYLLGIVYSMLKSKKNIKMLLALFIFSGIYFGYQFFSLKYGIVSSISNIFKYIYLPLSILYFKDFEFKKYDKRKVISIVLFTYISIFILSYIFGIGANAYLEQDVDGKKGFKGLFSSINEFSAIVVGSLIITVNYFNSKKKYIPIVLLIVGSSICSLLLGTKVLFGGIIFTIIYLGYLNRKVLFFTSKKRSIIVITSIVLVLVGGGFLFTKTRTYQNMKVQQNFFKTKNVLSFDYLNKVVFNDRLTFFNYNYDYYKKSDFTTKLIGFGYDDGYIKFCEIDICDIMFRFGIIGLVLFMVNLIAMPIKKLDTNEKIALILFLIMSLTSGHVLLTPNVCIYIGLLFSKNVLE